MTLGERIRTIIKERGVKQVEFAKVLGISPNYVNLLANDKKTSISDTLAKLVEETYGYSATWLLEGVGEKFFEVGVSASKVEIIKKIQKMSDCEARATLAFVKTLENVGCEIAQLNDQCQQLQENCKRFKRLC